MHHPVVHALLDLVEHHLALRAWSPDRASDQLLGFVVPPEPAPSTALTYARIAHLSAPWVTATAKHPAPRGVRTSRPRSARAAQDQEVLVRQDRARGDQPQPGAAGVAQETGAGHTLPGRRPKLRRLVPVHIDHARVAG